MKPRSEITIQTATLQDAHLLANIGASTFRETYVDLYQPNDLEIKALTKYSVEIQTKELQNPNTVFVLASLSNVPVGFAKLIATGTKTQYLPQDQYCQLQKIYVLKAYHGQAIGNALMQACIDRAKSIGSSGVWLGVEKGNDRAFHFYKKWKYQVLGEEPCPSGANNHPDIIMSLRLQ